ncbi:hypothetical protein HMPREF3039_01058 [Akkermansia sp. KLE1798]|nr:hypothetical protein HMPREF3039_01058 [Akkermansia sp. KLE1798]
MIPCLFLCVEGLKTGQNPAELGQAAQEQGDQHLYGFLGNNSLINIEITGKIFFW